MRKVRLGWNGVRPEAEEAVLEVLYSGQFSPGKKVREFEEKFASLHQVPHAIFVNSGTDALRCGLMAMKEKFKWRDGQYVAVTTQTFVASVNVILQCGLRPYFYDCGNSWNLERRVDTEAQKPDIAAVMPVHVFGRPSDAHIYELADERGWKVIEDSCETILNKPKGIVSCHSTYMAHHVTTGVGGVALTRDDDLMLLIRSYANHGRNVSYLPGFANEGDLTKRFRFDRIGYSSRGTEFEAALGLSQLDHIAENVAERRQVAQKLSNVLLKWWDNFFWDEPELSPGHTYMAFPICAKAGFPSFDKYGFCRSLEKKGIETRDALMITNQPCYADLVLEGDYPESARWNQYGFYLPCHPGMTDDDIITIRDCFRGLVVDKSRKVA